MLYCYKSCLLIACHVADHALVLSFLFVIIFSSHDDFHHFPAMAFYENAGWLSTFTFAWTNIVVKRGADAIRSGRGMSLEEIPDVG